MKFQCPACERLVELERFRVSSGVLIIECGKCAVESRVQVPTASSMSASVASTVNTVVSSPTPAPIAPPTQLPAPMPSAPMPRVSLVSSPTASNVVTLKTATTDAVQRAAESAAHPFEIPDTVCPKCIAKRGTGASCSQCGLVFSAFNPSLLAPAPWLGTEWVALLRDWSNDGRHERLRQRASESGELVQLARLYRLRLALCPDDPWAERAREEIVNLASAVALRPAPPAPSLSEDPRVKFGVAAVMIVMMVGALLYILSMLRST